MNNYQQIYHYIPTLHANKKACYIIDASGKFIYCNPATEKLTGYKEAELCKMNFKDLLAADAVEHTSEAFAESLDGLPQNIDTSIFNKDQRIVELSVAVVPYFIEGKVVYVIGIAKDITKEKHALKRLVESESRYRGVMHSAMDGIIVTDMHTRIVDFNPAAEEMFGYCRQDVIGKQLINLIFPPDKRDSYSQARDQLFKQNPASILGMRYELEGVRKTKEEFPMELGVTNIAYDGKVFLTLNIRDITKRRNLEESLIIAKEQAENSSKAKSAFLSSMSHELRTPLNAILGFAQLLKMEPLKASQLDDLEEIIKAAQHLLELINDILDLSSIEAGKIKLNLDAVNLADAVEDSLSLLAPLAAEKKIEVNWDPPAINHFVKSDYTRLRQILLNLLSNAIKYNKEAGKISVSISSSPSAGFLRLAVEDTGIGMNDHQLEEIFNPFHRLNPNTTVEGAGVGLSVVKLLAEQMGGQIGVESQPGVGTTFWVDLQHIS